jgi:hypothetical protein
MVLRSLSFLLLAGILSCKGDPTDSLRNGVNRLTADPTEIILDSAATQNVLIEAVDEQGNAVEAKFAVASAGAGITVTFDSSYNVVRDANGNLKPQNPATRVRYVVKGNAVGSSDFTISGGGKQVTVPVRVPPPALAATIDKPTPNPGDTISITLPAPAKFKFDPADTSSIGVTIGGNACKILTVTADASGVTCVPLPGSVGRPSFKNVLPGFGGLGPITVSATTTVTLPLPTLVLTPASPLAGDTVRIIAPAPYKFGTGTPTASDTSAVTVNGTVARTVRTADTLKFLVGPGINAALTVTRMRIPNFGGASNLFTLPGGSLVTPARPDLVTTPGGSVGIGSTVTVTASGRYRFSPAASTTVTIPSALTGINAGATVLAVSADSLTLTYAIGPNVANSKATIGGVRLSAAAALGTFSLSTDKPYTTPTLIQFPATLSDSNPAAGQAVTIRAGAGFKFTPTSAVQFGPTFTSALIASRAADSSAITFVPLPAIGRFKPVVTRVLQTAAPAVLFTLPAAVYLNSPHDGAADPSTAPLLSIPTTGNTIVFKDYATPIYPLSFCTGDLGVSCRVYKFVLSAAASFRVTATWSGTQDIGIYFYDSSLSIIPPFACDNFGSGAAGQPEICTVTKPAGTYYLVYSNFSATNPPDFTLTLLGL